MTILQASWILFMLFVGLGATIAAYLGAVSARRPQETAEAGSEHRDNPVPPVLWLLYISTGAGGIGYLIWAWLTRPNY